MEKINLNDIAGYEEEKEEARKIIEVFKNYKMYEEMGAYVPKGLILSGRPGVGKTMIAKAIACESNVPLYEFESDECETETKTIKSLKELFKKARENAPSIVFIDELDELVANEDFLSDYSRKTLKIILSEIDGIKNNSGVLVIATTNHRNSLPRALIRSGRMDKKISMPLPDLESREKIFNLYLNKNNFTKGFDAKSLASKTSGFSGSDIKTLINETIIDVCSKGNKTITIKDFERIIPQFIFQDIKRKRDDGEEESVIYHEIGHFIANYVLFGTIGSISIESYGDARGFTTFDEDYKKKERSTKNNLDNKVKVLLAGMAAEEVFTGDITLGSRDDVNRAYRCVEGYVKLGAFGFKYVMPSLNFGPKTDFIVQNTEQFPMKKLEIISDYVTEILDCNYYEIKKTLLNNKDLVEYISAPLKERRVLSKTEMEDLIKNYKLSIN